MVNNHTLMSLVAIARGMDSIIGKRLRVRTCGHKGHGGELNGWRHGVATQPLSLSTADSLLPAETNLTEEPL